MKLLIVSNMSHYRRGDELVGWGPTVEEISYLARLFDEVVHIGCLHPSPPPASSLPYTCGNLRFVGVRPAGGATLGAKAGVLLALPGWARVIARELASADVVHVRAPANISLLALLMLAVNSRVKKRWIKYAGNWQPAKGQPFSFRIQRALLRWGVCRAKVTANGRRPGDKPHVVVFPNPCFSEQTYRRGGEFIPSKQLDCTAGVQLAFVGALNPRKGAEVAVEALSLLRGRSVNAALEVAGDGPARAALEQLVRQRGLREWVNFHGFLPHAEVMGVLARSHFVLLPSASEGWPKVLSEGMAWGAVPIASAVSSIPQVLHEAGCGRALPSFEPAAYAAAIGEYLDNPTRWREEVAKGYAYAARFTYEAHVERVRQLLELNHALRES